MRWLLAGIFFLFLLTLLYSASSTQEGTIYPNFRSLGMRLETDITINSALTLSAGSIELGDNAVVCGTVPITIDPEMGSDWPTSTSNFYALAEYPLCNSYPSDCPSNPIPYDNSATINNPVKWLSLAEYNLVKYEYGWVNNVSDSIINTFYPAKVDYDRISNAEGIEAPNRKGKAGIFCKGTADITVKRGGTTVYSRSVDIKDMSSYATMLGDPGNYQIRVQYSEIKCLAAVEKYPADSGTRYYRFYMYNDNPITFPTMSDTQNLRVNAAAPPISLGKISTLPTEPGPLYMSAGDTLDPMVVVVQNNGATNVRVNNVAATGGFIAHPSTLVASNGFNTNIAPGDTAVLTYSLQAPTGIFYTLPTSTQITFSYNGDTTSCGSVQTGSFTVTYQVTNQTGDNGCVDLPDCPCSNPDYPNCSDDTSSRSGNQTCAISPDPVYIRGGQTKLLRLTCQNEAGVQEECNTPAWDVDTSRLTIVRQLGTGGNSGIYIKPVNPDEASLVVSATIDNTITEDYVCQADVYVQAQVCSDII